MKILNLSVKVPWSHNVKGPAVLGHYESKEIKVLNLHLEPESILPDFSSCQFPSDELSMSASLWQLQAGVGAVQGIATVCVHC